jgi:hypothetical protein
MKQATASFGTATVSPTLRHLGSPTSVALKAWGDSSYDSISASLNRRFQKWLGLRLSYTLSKKHRQCGQRVFFTRQLQFGLRLNF